MSIRLYESIKNDYDNVKPIRGRSTDVRPFYSRSRDNELLVRVIRDDKVFYGARLYNTDVFLVSPDGVVEIGDGGWNSNLTVGFLNTVMNRYMYGSMHVWREFSRTWLRCHGANDSATYVVSGGDVCLQLHYDPLTNEYRALEQQMVKQSQVNKPVLRELRASVKPFVTFVKTFLKMGDGFISKELRTKFTYDSRTFGTQINGALCLLPNYLNRQVEEHHVEGYIKFMQSGDTDAYLAVIVSFADAYYNRDADMRMSVEEFESKLDKVIKTNNPSVWHMVDVPVTHPIRNTA
jgi:hypothetical protein